MVGSFLSALLAVANTSPAQSPDCGIVTGDGWGLVSTPPPGWTAACGEGAMSGTAVTLWPQDEPSRSAALIYVTVSGKENESLSSFVESEFSRFKAEARHPGQVAAEPLESLSPTRKLLHLKDDGDGRDELIEYVEGPTAFFIIVFTCESAALARKYDGAFKAYLDSFSPASIARSDEKLPTSANPKGVRR